MKSTATLEAALKQPQFLQESLESGRAREWLKTGEFNSWYQHYYRLIAGMDNSIGQILELLAENGVDENTVIVFIGDNGHFMGEHGFMGKWLLYEESIRVPCFIHDPRLPEAKRGKVSEGMVLNVDIYPTIAALAGVKPPREVQGKSLLPLLGYPYRKVRDGSFFEHHFTLGPPLIIAQSEGYCDRDWKYIRYTEQDPVVEELYDLRKDPLEENNLANNPEYRKVLKQYRTSLETSRRQLSEK